MKAFIEFIGETRYPKAGDLIMRQSGAIARVSVNHTYVVFPIVTRHEIDIPDGANILTVQTRGTCNTLPAIHIPIPRPKKKVKKWIYEFNHRGIAWRSTVHLSEAEYDAQYMSGHKVLETEIEVVYAD